MATRARIRFAYVVASVAVSIGASACSIISTFDGLTDGGTAIVAHDAGRDAEIIDGNPVVSDARADAGSDACTPGVASCGVDLSGGDKTALYQCDDNRVATMVQQCPYGCVNQSSTTTAGETIALCSPCSPGGKYCGGDKIGTDTSTLYLCNPDGTATVEKKCGLSGCKVNANGTDDQCIL